MSYHAVENYLRKFRRDAKAMNGKATVAASSPVRAAAKATPKKAKGGSPTKEGGVNSGRVEKKKAAPKVKTEVVEDAAEEMLYGEWGFDEDEELEGEV